MLVVTSEMKSAVRLHLEKDKRCAEMLVVKSQIKSATKLHCNILTRIKGV
jgi:hypothetical protein